MKLLNLTHNKVHQIHFEAFKGLEKLRSLDLSFNAIEYFTESWFESLRSLEELYLRGNKLRKINEQPPIDIETLRVSISSHIFKYNVPTNYSITLSDLRHKQMWNNPSKTKHSKTSTQPRNPGHIRELHPSDPSGAFKSAA